VVLSAYIKENSAKSSNHVTVYLIPYSSAKCDIFLVSIVSLVATLPNTVTWGAQVKDKSKAIPVRGREGP
jgi:hypothetical protein